MGLGVKWKWLRASNLITRAWGHKQGQREIQDLSVHAFKRKKGSVSAAAGYESVARFTPRLSHRTTHCMLVAFVPQDNRNFAMLYCMASAAVILARC